MQITECITAFGHRNIRATHRTTLEITKEKTLSLRGDCIIAVSADRGLLDFKPEFKTLLCRNNARLTIIIDVDEVTETVEAYGSQKLALAHPTDLVVRKSEYICERTLAIKANKAAFDLSRKLAEKLRDPKQKVKIILTVKV
ncbi:DUF371 domain-containing protein [Candidatus Bathyarchaeota archaeon]|nr:DUF371 domain-containing protein [Candidatus Bathyarchaeota archaeon]